MHAVDVDRHAFDTTVRESNRATCGFRGIEDGLESDCGTLGCDRTSNGNGSQSERRNSIHSIDRTFSFGGADERKDELVRSRGHSFCDATQHHSLFARVPSKERPNCFDVQRDGFSSFIAIGRLAMFGDSPLLVDVILVTGLAIRFELVDQMHRRYVTYLPAVSLGLTMRTTCPRCKP